ncbi:TetR/AcrR family transcriptional regulator [Brucella pseudogrignonensis]|uniref:AcrR family transcriptional regulator n=1 Tax=Brucella pseudogrignonensis TaxID=419475 RepID=A0ABU1MB01_9HYPH|nr:TetR/AcrR family transcriptional regulator [Brucella pseudogrignonensis]MDR6433214.1 AcrR family transcriptional regulator [Brucella pseudogrignonensis]
MSELKPVFSTVDARDKLLEAALTAFAELGFHGATVRDITQRAGVSQGLLTHHFGDKERLWNLVGKLVSDDFLEFLGPALEKDDIDAETIPNILSAYMMYWRSHPSALRLQIWRVLGAPETERRTRVERLNQKIVPIFARAQEAGYIRNDVSAGQAMVTAGSVIQYRLHSELEMQNAVSITGDVLPDDEAFLRYTFSLIAPQAS